MTNPAYPQNPQYPYDTGRYDTSPNSPAAQQEWQQFMGRRQELLNILIGQMQELTGPKQQDTQQPPVDVGQTRSMVPMLPQDQAREDETRRDLLQRADFWKIPNADQMSIQDLQTA